MNQLSVYAALLICLAACGKASWTEAQKVAFKSKCMTGVSERAAPYHARYCDCVSAAGQSYDYAEFDLKGTSLLYRDSPEKLSACVKEMGGQ